MNKFQQDTQKVIVVFFLTVCLFLYSRQLPLNELLTNISSKLSSGERLFITPLGKDTYLLLLVKIQVVLINI